MILTFIKMNALPEKQKELRQTLQSIVVQMRKEGGCLDSCLYQDTENENNFSLVESWENRKAWEDHQGSLHFTVLVGARSLLREPPEIVRHTVSHSEKLKIVNSRIKLSL